MALTDSLQGYWKMDEASGNASDSTANANTLTNNGTLTYGAAKINNGAQPTATGSKFLSIANASQVGLGFTSSFTIALWVKINSTGITQSLIVKTDSGTGLSGYRMRINTDQTFTCTTLNDVTTGGCDSLSTLTSGTFYHLAGVFNGITMVVYLNGAQNNSALDAISPTTDVNSLRFGCNGVGGQFLEGTMDEVGMWSRALSGAEIDELYNSGFGIQHPFTTAEGLGTLSLLDAGS